MKGKGLIALGTIGALAYMAANNKSGDEITKADLAALGFTGTGNNTVDQVLEALKNSSTLRNLLKGEKGNTGSTGLQGPTGAAGLDGNSKSYGGSLAANSAMELGNLEGWTSMAVLGDLVEGLNTLTITSAGTFVPAANSNRFFLDSRRLYRLSCNAKSTGNSYYLFLRRYDKDNNLLSHAGDAGIYPLNISTMNNTSFQNRTLYFGGVSTSVNTSIGVNTVKGAIVVSTSIAGTVTVSKMIVEQVPLGEPLPYNLSWLPTGQTVVDPTTSKLGYYNGTTIVWSA